MQGVPFFDTLISKEAERETNILFVVDLIDLLYIM